MMESIDDGFEQLKGLLARPALSQPQRQRLFALMRKAYFSDRDVYHTQWLAHIRAFPHHFRQGEVPINCVEELKCLFACAPDARFAVRCANDLNEARAVLIGAPPDAQITSIEMVGDEIDLAFIDLFTRWPSLTSLTLESCWIDDDSLDVIINVLHATQLHTLALPSNEIGVDGVRALAHAAFNQLTTLDLSLNYMREDGVEALVNSTNMQRLNALHLSGCDLSDRALIAVARAPYMARLKTLNMSNNVYIGDSAVATLVNSSHMSELVTLDLRGNELGEESALSFSTATVLSNLRELLLDCSRLGARGVDALATSTYLSEQARQPFIQYQKEHHVTR